MKKPVKIFVHKWIKKPGAINYTSKLMLAREYEDEAQDDEEICDHAFRIFNAPEETLLKEEIKILGDYHRNFPSISVDDYVQVGGECFRCAREGWEKINNIPEGEEKELV